MNSFIDSKISKNYFMSNLIFVYGTLRWSESRNSVLSDSEYLGLFQSCPEYTMVDLGSFPGPNKVIIQSLEKFTMFLNLY